MTAELPKQAIGIVVDKFDDWRNVKFGTLPLRPPQEGELLIRCEAAALNFQDLLMIEGNYQFKPSLPFIAGSDIAGRIAAVGPGVEEFAINQPVAALAQFGAFADYAIVRASRCFPLPEELSATTSATCLLRSGLARFSTNTRTGTSYLRTRSTRPATWNSAPNTIRKKPSTISCVAEGLALGCAIFGDAFVLAVGRRGGGGRGHRQSRKSDGETTERARAVGGA